MQNMLMLTALIATLLPLMGSIVVGLLGAYIGNRWSHRFAIGCVSIAFLLSCYLFNIIALEGHPAVEDAFYVWATAGMMHFEVGFLLDRLSAVMMMIVLFVSLAVHIYTIGYMADDAGYTRFFSYVSLFTFAMLVLVMANNFLVLFFGWEGVGLVSYLLIGYWFERESAAVGGLKAFLVNRIGDIGFVLGIACIFRYFGTLSYHDVFTEVPTVLTQTFHLFGGHTVSVISLICALLFIGAVAKSAQVPLHVWLPESMEGPTPISALIHAATMVTAGIYMIARMSPLFEYSPVMLSTLLIVGGTTAFFMGLLAITQYDIKRVIAYSTISQLGYMVVALGASAYDVAIFHLITHAFFKALLFLAAGSVIIAMHHEQDMRRMGGLYRRLPITYGTFLIGALALCAIPPFSGFFSKDTIIDVASLSQMPGARYAYYCVLLGAFVTPLYTFRALFMVFHDRAPGSAMNSAREHAKESPWVILIPLILLAIPSVFAGDLLISPMLYHQPTLLGNAVFVLPQHNVVEQLASEFSGAMQMALEAGMHLSFWLAIGGILCAWVFTVGYPQLSEKFKQSFSWVYRILVDKYGFDAFNQFVFVRGTQEVGHLFYDVSDVKFIDGVCVNGMGHFVRRLARVMRRIQTGYLYHYALGMVLGMVVFLSWLMWG
ncbi:MAG TPA: NADH-quinone oxidoreductase subunit L [Gammaproteobacteria bacterium]|jgi:NADH-quinone oxidoreductase subunit L|nr:NADH-quinone oxidoreductase subunit L [Gammaproteobacteria bacterium]